MSRSRGTRGAVRRGKYRQSALGVGGGVSGGGVGSGSGGGGSSGITELTGDVTAGPGSGSVAATIAALAVTTGKIAALAVTDAKLAADSVITSKILNANVTTAKLADLAVTTAKIDNLAVTTGKLADLAVTTAKIDNLAVTAGKIAADAVTTAKILDANVTLAKLADLAGLSVPGRSANSTGVMAAITAANDGEILRRSGATIGFGTIPVAGIADGSITLAKLADIAALSVLGRSANTAGVPAAIAAANDLEVLRRSGTAIGFGKVAYGGIQDVSATSKVLGRKSSGSGIIEELSVADVLTLLGFVNAGGSLYTGSGHPQGVVSAPIGNIYIDLASGYQYSKVGGGSTAYGWYLDRPYGGIGLGGPTPWVAVPSGVASSTGFPRSNGYGYWSPSVADAIDAWATPTNILTNGTTYVSGKRFVSMAQNATNGQSMYITTVVATAAQIRQPLDDDVDVWVEMRTGADVTNCRIWFGITNSVISDSATFGTGGQGSLMLRYSTAEADGGWIGQTCKNGGANHTETATVAAIAADTIYRLRIRFVRQGTPTVYFSVNDSTEISVTTNIAPSGSTYFLTFGVTNKTGTAHTLLWRGFAGAFGS